MKKIIITILLLGIFSISYSQIADDEIRVDDKGISFVDFIGDYTYTEPESEIVRIGKLLSDGLKENDNKSFNYHSKYSVKYRGNNENNGKYNAIIFSIDTDAKVDKIRNVRAIISSFLSNQYGYNNKDADVLSYFLTVYNNVYRGNINYFTGKYKKELFDVISEKNVGISRIYSEWISNTKIVIPLTNEGLMQVPEVLELSDKEVVNRVKTESEKIDLKNNQSVDNEIQKTDKALNDNEQSLPGNTNKNSIDSTETVSINSNKDSAETTEKIDIVQDLLEIKEKDIQKKEAIIIEAEQSNSVSNDILAEIKELKEEIEKEKDMLVQVEKTGYKETTSDLFENTSNKQKNSKFQFLNNKLFFILPIVALLLILLIIFLIKKLKDNNKSLESSGSGFKRRNNYADEYQTPIQSTTKSEIKTSKPLTIVKNEIENKEKTVKQEEDITDTVILDSENEKEVEKIVINDVEEQTEPKDNSIVYNKARFRIKNDLLGNEKISKFQLIYNKDASFIDDEEHTGEQIIIESKLNITEIGEDFLITTGDIGLYLDEIVDLKKIKLRVDSADFNKTDSIYQYKLKLIDKIEKPLNKIFTIKDSVVGEKKMAVFGQDSAVIDKLVSLNNTKTINNRSIDWQDCKIKDTEFVGSFLCKSQPIIDSIIELSINGTTKEYFIYKIKFTADVYECFIK